MFVSWGLFVNGAGVFGRGVAVAVGGAGVIEYGVGEYGTGVTGTGETGFGEPGTGVVGGLVGHAFRHFSIPGHATTASVPPAHIPATTKVEHLGIHHRRPAERVRRQIHHFHFGRYLRNIHLSAEMIRGEVELGKGGG